MEVAQVRKTIRYARDAAQPVDGVRGVVKERLEGRKEIEEYLPVVVIFHMCPARASPEHVTPS